MDRPPGGACVNSMPRVYRWLGWLRSLALSWLRVQKLRLLGARVGRGVIFHGPVILMAGGDPSRIDIGDGVGFMGRAEFKTREQGRIIIDEGCTFDSNVRLVAAREATIHIHRNVAVGRNFIVNAGADVTIGECCLFSSNINVHSSQHRCIVGESVLSQGYVQEPVFIGRDVWMASNVNVLFGTSLGDECIVAPNALVSGRFEARSVLTGVPAICVAKRDGSLKPLQDLASAKSYMNALMVVANDANFS